jgi:branched-subunit amino acid ABC-type transport system permease component
MTELIVFVVAGLVAGSVYSLAGVGLVLTYRTSGLLNFAHGAIATVAAYAFYSDRQGTCSSQFHPCGSR